ncbi:hypothetical protein ACERII_01150 [Evansella sp. AB-rgal1]|uniref:hypothetical protein n=1 Tax=Evansella sp. AB-rgal1 TaxID=3242696 RepID=UPI00359CD74E
MDRVLRYTGIFVFIGWTIAILVNFPIYQYTTKQATLFHPIVDGVLFMAIMLVIYFVIIKLYKNKQSFASIGLAFLGVISLAMAFYYYIA